MCFKSIIKKLFFSVALLSCPVLMSAAERGGTFTVGKNTFLLNGKPFIVKAAEMHYPRIPRAYWEHRIKMCKALGMNTICLYVFWNIHEQKEGQFDFTGNNDVASFCRLAQKNGMYVIVRPGPYVCAEWEMGGLPWWLLKKKDIKLRERDPYFMKRVEIFEKEVGKQLAPLTIQNGGPIIMVQVENEYGSYGKDKPYVSAIRDIVKSSGFDKVTLFQCDWSSNFTNNGLDDLCWTMNFGTGANIDGQFRKLKELRPDAPLMCSEFWSGWFDKWGARHETRPAKVMIHDIDEMLSKGISFSLYMTHGGTSFGHWAGANSPGFAPDVTSYDYDAPISENGSATPKYMEMRTMMAKYNGGKSLPSIPAAIPVISVPKFNLNEFAPLQNGLDKTVNNHEVLTMEDMDMGYGSMIYSATLPQVSSQALLTITNAHDFAQVFVDGKYIGTVNRVNNETGLLLPPLKKGSKLTILVEAMGRINFGRAIKDHKGITDKVTLSYEEDGNAITCDLKNWTMSTIPDDYATALKAFSSNNKDNFCSDKAIGYYRGYFNLKKTGDTYLDFSSFGKGQVYVNGHPLGRIWSIGPQQTLYTPGCWLKKGKNEVIVLDITGPKAAQCSGLMEPIIDKLNLQSLPVHRKKGETFETANLPLVKAGAFEAGNGWQTVTFDTQASGRYLVVECLDAHDGKNYASIAELYAIGADGKNISREPWTVRYADSEDVNNGNKSGDKVFDLQESTYWSTCKNVKFPHVLVIDLGSEQVVNGIRYLPRAEQGAPGSIKDYRIYLYK